MLSTLVVTVSDFDVFLQIAQVGTAVTTELAFIWSLSCMLTNVSSHVVNPMCVIVTLIATNKIKWNIWSNDMTTKFGMLKYSFCFSGNLCVAKLTVNEVCKKYGNEINLKINFQNLINETTEYYQWAIVKFKSFSKYVWSLRLRVHKISNLFEMKIKAIRNTWKANSAIFQTSIFFFFLLDYFGSKT